MKLVACPQCHAQYDLDARPEVGGDFACRCGARLEAVAPRATSDTRVERCSGCGAIAKAGEERCAFCGSGIVPSADPGALICPECYARNLDAARFCAACGVAFAPQAIPEDERSATRCPCCERAMHAREIAGLVVHECEKCLGLWAPQERFRALVERAASIAVTRKAGGSPPPRVESGNPLHSPVAYRRCPICAEMMARRNYQKRSGVVIDQCHQHGTWLDANELEHIAGYVLSGRAQRDEARESVRTEELERRAADAAVRRVVADDAGSRGKRLFFEHDEQARGVSTIADFLAVLLN